MPVPNPWRTVWANPLLGPPWGEDRHLDDNPTPFSILHYIWKPALAWKTDASFHFAVHPETEVHIKLDAVLKINPDEVTSVHLKADACSQFMYDFGTGVHLNWDTGSHFIRPLWGSARPTWAIGVGMVFGVSKCLLALQWGFLYIVYRRWSSHLQVVDVLITVPTMRFYRDDRQSPAN